jgi:carotenoid cleavage dioxygenase
MPSRFAVLPRRGGTDEIHWFDADPTFVLHFTNAYEDGDEIVLDGFFEGDPAPVDTLAGDKYQKAFRFLALDGLQTRLHRWRFNLVTGQTSEEQLSDSITEFGMINAAHAGSRYRYTYAATGKPGWFLFDGLVKHDLHTGAEERFAFDDGVFGSETAMAPRIGSTGEDDGYLVTLTTDMTADASYCLVFDAARVADGPICKLPLPERISSGTHSTWAPGAELRRWREADSAPAAIGL